MAVILLGACFVSSGIMGILFPRHIAEFVVQAFRKIGGLISDPAPIPLLTIFYRLVGVVQFGLGVAILIYAA